MFVWHSLLKMAVCFIAGGFFVGETKGTEEIRCFSYIVAHTCRNSTYKITKQINSEI